MRILPAHKKGAPDRPSLRTACDRSFYGWQNWRILSLTFAWTLNGKPDPTVGPSMLLSFNPSIGPFGTQTVAVKVTDEDGLTAELERLVGGAGRAEVRNS